VRGPLHRVVYPTHCHSSRLRQVDVKAEHFERQVQRAEQERDGWEKKYEVHRRPPEISSNGR
jgi:hypothetical protein